MRKPNAAPKSTTRKRGKPLNPKEKPQLPDRGREKAVLEIWENVDVYPLANRKPDTIANDTAEENATPPPRSDHQAEPYVLREMPTAVDALTFSTLSAKVCQDVFLKAALMQGHHVTYVPAWETYPLRIEEALIKEARSKPPVKLSVLRKRCRAQHKQELEVQKQKFHQLGIFGDWETSQKMLESRQEAKLIALISRLRDSNYLQDLPQLSPWCPNCAIPINETNLLQRQTHTMHGYVKFPFSVGLEEFGVNVFLCLEISRLWELTGIVALGITDDTTYHLTELQGEYLLFAEPQLERWTQQLQKGEPKPKLIKKIKTTELTECVLTHPLFPSKDLNITLIPEAIAADASIDALTLGVLPLNPAHDQPSYNIAQALKSNAPAIFDEAGLNTTPIFDETGRFTEEAAQLCGLYLFDAEKFIVPQLKKCGYLLKTEKVEREEPHCQRCKELAVFRPCSKWVFSTSENHATAQLLNAQEYWDNYGDSAQADIRYVQDVVLNFSELQVSAQRQWGMPLPILLCDQCDEPLTEKNTLKAIQNSIQRGFEFWFRLSVEELLPGDTRCLKCNSSDFRKEATLIDSHFANLLQTIDNSDFKRPLGGHTSVMFVPQTAALNSKWTKWLAEVSVISAALSRSRPIKESQPFKQLKLSTIPEMGTDAQVEDAFLKRYPADVVRLIAVTPTGETAQRNARQLKKLGDDYFVQYQQLQTRFADVSELLYPFLAHGQSDGADSVTRTLASVSLQALQRAKEHGAEAERAVSMDSLVITLTAQLLADVQQAYSDEDFHGIWTRFTEFCEGTLQFYVDLMETRSETTLPVAQAVLSEITTAILQRLAPLTPFLAEHFYHLTSVEGLTGNHSIFQKNWHLFSAGIGQALPTSDMDADRAKAEWEALKSSHDAKT